jgi:heterodisulfide reductase subunit A-like polyferredoxin
LPERPAIVYCHCSYAQVLDAGVKSSVLSRLAESGQAFTAVPDLCEMSARRDERLQQIASCGPCKISACHPRAVNWLFHAAGAPLDPAQVEIVNLRELSADTAAFRLLSPELASTAG